MMSKNMAITPGTIQTNYYWQSNIRPFVQVRDNVFANGNVVVVAMDGLDSQLWKNYLQLMRGF